MRSTAARSSAPLNLNRLMTTRMIGSPGFNTKVSQQRYRTQLVSGRVDVERHRGEKVRRGSAGAAGRARQSNAEPKATPRVRRPPACPSRPDAALQKASRSGRRSEARVVDRSDGKRTAHAPRPDLRRRRSPTRDDDRQPAADLGQPCAILTEAPGVIRRTRTFGAPPRTAGASPTTSISEASRAARFVVAVAGALAVAARSSRPAPIKQTYLPRSARRPRWSRSEIATGVGPRRQRHGWPELSFRGRSIVFRESDLRYENAYYLGGSVPAGDDVARADVARWSGRRRVSRQSCRGPASAAATDWELDGFRVGASIPRHARRVEAGGGSERSLYYLFAAQA